MNGNTSRPVSNLTLALYYLAIFVGGVIALNVLYLLLETFLRFNPSNGAAMAFLLMVASAGSVGQIWYRREHVGPSGARAWRVALLCLLATILVQILLLGFFYVAAGMPGSPLGGAPASEQPLLAGVVAFVLLLQLLLIRLGLFMGGRQAQKKDKRAIAETFE
ncbi:ABZJ_00895 family protein [Camelimonas sp. ID_303_24]